MHIRLGPLTVHLVGLLVSSAPQANRFARYWDSHQGVAVPPRALAPDTSLRLRLGDLQQREDALVAARPSSREVHTGTRFTCRGVHTVRPALSDAGDGRLRHGCCSGSAA